MQTAASPDVKCTESALREEIAALGPWFHNMLLDGVPTAPHHFLGDYPTVKWQQFRQALPADMHGMSVLDIGCNAGFYSFAMKLRGADRVLGIDWDDMYLNQARFAAQVLGQEVDFRRMSVWEIGALGEKFDLVIFMGVLYHLRHPLLALDLIHEHVCRDQLLFQSMQRGSSEVMPLQEDYDFSQTEVFNDPGYPRMHFVEHCYTGDSTNWWLPNQACVEAMLRSAGFRLLSHPEQEVYLCQWEPLQEDPSGARCVYPAAGSASSSRQK